MTGRLLAEHLLSLLGESPGPAPRPPGGRMAAKQGSSVGGEPGPARGPVTPAGLLLSGAPSPKRSVSRVPPNVLPWRLFCPGGPAGACSPSAALRGPRVLPVPPPLPQPILSPGGEPRQLRMTGSSWLIQADLALLQSISLHFTDTAIFTD